MDLSFIFTVMRTMSLFMYMEKAEGNAKYWLEPALDEEYSYGFTTRQKREIKEIIKNNHNELITFWNEYFG